MRGEMISLPEERSPMGALRHRLFGIDPSKTSPHALGFAEGTPAARAQLEGAARSFVDGYNLALRITDVQRLADELTGCTTVDRTGFAFEGAAMALTIFD